MTDTRHIPQEDLALYAMQALAGDERAEIHRHLKDCPECRAELAAVSGDLALLAFSVEQQPLPEGARQRFLDRISAASASEAAAPASQPVVAPVIPIDAPRAPRRALQWIPWVAVAAMLFVTVALQIEIHRLSQQLSQKSAELVSQNAENARAQAILDLLTAPQAEHVALAAAKSHPAPTARAVYLPSRGALLMQASNLDPVAPGKTYELWIIPTKGAPVPAGTFHPDSAGNASVVLPTLPEGIEAKAFGVTIENAGGSSTPTMPIVLQGAPSPGE